MREEKQKENGCLFFWSGNLVKVHRLIPQSCSFIILFSSLAHLDTHIKRGNMKLKN